MRVSWSTGNSGDPTGSKSDYVTLCSADGGETTHWSVDLERALKEPAVNRGDRVALERLGKRSVAVRWAVLNARGEISCHEEKVVERTPWAAPVLERESLSGNREPSPRASEDLGVVKALALLERRLPDLRDTVRDELHRYFDAAHAREQRSRNVSVPSRVRNGPSPSLALACRV